MNAPWNLRSAGLAFVICLVGCSPGNSKDAHLSNQLIGTWVLTVEHPDGSRLTTTVTVKRNCDYVSHTVKRGTSGSVVTNRSGGILKVENGMLISTANSSTGTNAILPPRTRMPIVRLDDREMVLALLPEATNFPPLQVVFKRTGK
jgi:hypothetical protein